MKSLPLELIMRKPTANKLRHHYYDDLNKLSIADPKRISEIIERDTNQAKHLIERAKEEVNKNGP
jgi:hypothetical protein